MASSHSQVGLFPLQPCALPISLPLPLHRHHTAEPFLAPLRALLLQRGGAAFAGSAAAAAGAGVVVAAVGFWHGPSSSPRSRFAALKSSAIAGILDAESRCALDMHIESPFCCPRAGRSRCGGNGVGCVGDGGVRMMRSGGWVRA